MYGFDDRCSYNEHRVVMKNPRDKEETGIKSVDIVNLYNFTIGVQREALNFVVVAYDILRKTIAPYFPEANVLVSITQTVEISHTSGSKYAMKEIKQTYV